jgi:phosphohistidine phosphatase
MELLVIRHAIAEDRDEFAKSGRDDSERPLTAEGVRKMRRGARGLRRLVPRLDALVASPLVRARETAEILRKEYDLDAVGTAPELEPAAPLGRVVAALARLDGDVVAIVGHDPQLSRLVTYLLGGVDRIGVEIRKGGACLLECERGVRRSGGTLRWAATPRLLRDLGG